MRFLTANHQFKALISFILMFFLSLIFHLSWGNITYAQLPNIPAINNPDDLRDLKDPRYLTGEIGNLAYAPVRLDGRAIFLVAAPINTEGKNKAERFAQVNVRVRQIENNLKEIINRGFNPETLNVTPAILNNQTVILVSDQPTLQTQLLGTITPFDAQLQGLSIDEIAQQSSKKLRQVLIWAWEQRQPDYLKIQSIFALKILGVIIAITLTLFWLQTLLEDQVAIIKKSLTNLVYEPEKTNANQELITVTKKLKKAKNLRCWLAIKINQLTFSLSLFIDSLKVSIRIKEFKINNQLSSHLKFKTIPDSNLIYVSSESLGHGENKEFDNEKIKSIFKEQLHISVFFRRLLIITLGFIWILGIAHILALFPQTRELGIWLAGTPILLLLIWIGVIIISKIAELLIDWSLKAWMNEIHLTCNTLPRENLRIPTLGSALKGISIFLLVAIGIILSLSILSIPIAPVLAGAGILGFAISFGAQSLIKDMLSGAVNLVIDSYAVGDVIVLDNANGLVEEMNLFVTRIRNPDGDFITIPNGSVGIVRNQSKDWSRVNLMIPIGYETDADKALAIITKVANKIFEDPLWQQDIIEPPTLLGIDDLSHMGIGVRLWIKTKPAKQWNVGRELRLRLRKAFDEEGISIGIPQQYFLLKNNDQLLKKTKNHNNDPTQINEDN